MAFATYVRLTCLLHTANQTLDVIKVVAVCGRPDGDRRFALWARDAEGGLAMRASAEIA